MARPKDSGVSAAFQEKATAEQDKLEQRLARHLQEDMTRLLEDECHADLSLHVAGTTLRVHTAIIKQRAPFFYNKYLRGVIGSSVTIETENVSCLQTFIRSVYTSDVIPPCQWNMAESNDVTVTSEVTSGITVDSNGNGHHEDATEEQSENDATQSEEGRSNGHQLNTQTGCCQLATDLLTMYHESTNSDVIVVAQGKRFNAHRCVLSTRSSYFAAMLSGAWIESSTQEINLEGVSAGVVEQALLFMYGGRAELTPTCDLSELVMVSDMYGIAGIKDIASFILKRDYCHFFHKPCNGCVAGVVETLPLTITFRLNDLQDRCLKWCTKHFVRTWPTKPFALLPQEVLDKCCGHLISEIGVKTVLDIIVDADRLTGVMPQVRWAEPVVTLTRRLMDTCIKYLGSNLVAILGSQRFLALNTTMAMGMDFLQDVMKRSVAEMPVQKACTTYLQCRKLAEEADRKESSEGESDWSEDFCNLLRTIYKYCEQYMHQYVHLAMGTEDWKLLSPAEQARIKEGGAFVIPQVSKYDKQPPKKPTGPSRPTMLPSKRRTRNRPASSSKTPPSGTPSPAGGSASSGARTPQTPQNKKGPGASSPRAPGQTRLTPTATTPGTSSKSKTMSLTLKKSQGKESQQSGNVDGAGGGAKPPEAAANADAEGPPVSCVGVNGESSSVGSEGASVKGCKEDTVESRGSGEKLSNVSGANASEAAVNEAAIAGAAIAGAAANSVGACEKDAIGGAAVAGQAGEEAAVSKEDNKKKTVAKQPVAGDHVAKAARAEGHGPGKARAAGTKIAVSKAAEARPSGSKAAEAKPSGSRVAQAKPAGSRAAAAGAGLASKKDMNNKNKSESSASASRDRPREIRKPQIASGASGQRAQAKDAKTAANLRKSQNQVKSDMPGSPPNRRSNTGKYNENAMKAKPSLSLLPKTRPKSAPTNRSKDSDQSKTSSASSAASSPRSTGSASRLPVANKYPMPRITQFSNKQNDAVFAKCTTMRIAAMKKQKPFDADLDLETESVISTISHIAVKGSRSTSIADLDLSPNESEVLYNGVCNKSSTPEDVQYCPPQEVQFCPPQDHNDVIIPVYDAIFTEPDATKDR